MICIRYNKRYVLDMIPYDIRYYLAILNYFSLSSKRCLGALLSLYAFFLK